MKWINYSKYTGDDFGLSAEVLLKALSDFFLQSGFQNQYMGFSEWNQHTLEDLKNAIQRALEQGELFDPAQAERIQELETCRRSRWIKCSIAWCRSWWTKATSTRKQQIGQAGGRKTRAQRRDHRQVRRLSRIQNPQGPARIARQIEFRRTRYARSLHRRRNQRRGQALRIRRYLNLDISQTLSSAIQREGSKSH